MDTIGPDSTANECSLDAFGALRELVALCDAMNERAIKEFNCTFLKVPDRILSVLAGEPVVTFCGGYPNVFEVASMTAFFKERLSLEGWGPLSAVENAGA
jgi:hypothetical protein